MCDDNTRAILALTHDVCWYIFTPVYLLSFFSLLSQWFEFIMGSATVPVPLMLNVTWFTWIMKVR